MAESIIHGDTYSTESFSAGTTAQTSGKVTKLGRVCWLQLNGFTNTPTGSFTISNAIPAGYRPKEQVEFTAMRNYSTTQAIQVVVQTDGALKCYNYGAAISSGFAARASVSYVIA